MDTLERINEIEKDVMILGEIEKLYNETSFSGGSASAMYDLLDEHLEQSKEEFVSLFKEEAK